MKVQFCNEAKSCAYWLVNKTIWYETETRLRHLIFSPDKIETFPHFHETKTRHLKTTSRDCLETETSRPRRRDQDYIPATDH